MASAWRYSILFIALLLCSIAIRPTTATDDEETDGARADSDVVILTNDNFDELTATGSWLIEFFAPWCGHCKKLKPIWERVATRLDGKIHVATVDCTVEKDLQDRFEVKSFPTLKFFRDGSSRMYKGERTEDALIKFGLDMLKPPVENVESVKDMKEAISGVPVSFLFIQGTERTADTSAKVFDKVAYQNQGVFKFLRGRGDKLTQKYGATTSTIIALCEGGDDEKYGGAWTEDAVRKWMDDRKLPLLSELDASNFEDVTGAGKIVVFLVTDPSASTTRMYLKEALNVAKKYRQFVFANIDGIKFSKYVSQFGITPEILPSIFALNYPRDEFYVESEDLTKYQNQNQISRFADDIISGRIAPRGTSAWYSPIGWYKSLEKFLGTLSETQLIIGVSIATILLIALILAGCYYGAQDLAPEPTAAAKKAAADTKKTS